jgi:hypothetical protein
MARTVGWKIEQHANCTNAAEEWVLALPDTVTPVIFNSWVLLPADALAEHVRRMHALVCVRRIIWISAEHANVRVSSEIIRPVPSERPKELAEATVWTVSTCHEGRSVSKIVARSHPHGKWAEWFGPR